LREIVKRLATCRLEVNLEKTRIVYCKDDRRKGSHEHARFDFLGYAFRPRQCKGGPTGYFVGFNPAVSDAARKKIAARIRSWHLRRWSGSSLSHIAQSI